ncbi:MAG: universal stress protein [Bryobacteraceae bacterium]
MVGLARTTLDGELLRYCAMLAGLRHEEPPHFNFVHVLNPDGESDHGQVQRQIQADVEACFRPGETRAFWSCTVIAGQRTDRLLEFAAENSADVMVIGHHRARTGRRSLARRLAMNAPCSLWMAPEGSAAKLTRVLVGVDFSHHSAYALSTGAALARSADLEECLGVQVYFDQVAAMYGHNDDGQRQRSAETFARFIEPLNLHGRRLIRLLEASPSVATGVLRVAAVHDADLVVMGTRGLTASLSVLLGSETEQVIRESTLPVLIIKQPGERIGLLKALLDRDFRSPYTVRFG